MSLQTQQPNTAFITPVGSAAGGTPYSNYTLVPSSMPTQVQLQHQTVLSPPQTPAQVTFALSPPGVQQMGPMALPPYGLDFSNLAFRKRHERIDWRKLSSLDVDRVASQMDLASLQDNVAHITYCNIDAEIDTTHIDSNFVKLFKLAQLIIEYLLLSQELLSGSLQSIQERIDQQNKESAIARGENERLRNELSQARQESHKRKKLLAVQQQLIHRGPDALDAYKKCAYCLKSFITEEFLRAHMVRRHPDKPFAHSQNGAGHPVPGSIPSAPITSSSSLPPGSLTGTNEKDFAELRQHVRTLEEERKLRENEFTLWKEEQLKRQQNELDRMRDNYLKDMRELTEKVIQLQAHNASSPNATLNHSGGGNQRASLIGPLRDDEEVERERERERVQVQQQHQFALQQELERLKERLEQNENLQRMQADKNKINEQQRIDALSREHQLDIQRMQLNLQQMAAEREREMNDLRAENARVKRNQRQSAKQAREWELQQQQLLQQQQQQASFMAPSVTQPHPPAKPAPSSSQMQGPDVSQTPIISLMSVQQPTPPPLPPKQNSPSSQPLLQSQPQFQPQPQILSQQPPLRPASPPKAQLMPQPQPQPQLDPRVLERMHTANVVAGRMLIAHLGIIRPPFSVGEELVNNPNLLTDAKHASEINVANELNQHGLPLDFFRITTPILNDRRGILEKERAQKAARIPNFLPIRQAYQAKLDELVQDRLQGGTKSEPMQQSSVYVGPTTFPSDVPDTRLSGGSLRGSTGAPPRSPRSSRSKKSPRQASPVGQPQAAVQYGGPADNVNIPYTYSSTPQPARSQRSFERNAFPSASFNASLPTSSPYNLNASVGSAASFAPSNLDSSLQSTLTPQPIQLSQGPSGAVPMQQSQGQGQVPPPMGFVNPLSSAALSGPMPQAQPIGFMLPPGPPPPPPPRDNLLNANQMQGFSYSPLDQPLGVQVPPQKQRVTFNELPINLDDDQAFFDEDINRSDARHGLSPQASTGLPSTAAQRAASLARNSDPALNLTLQQQQQSAFGPGQGVQRASPQGAGADDDFTSLSDEEDQLQQMARGRPGQFSQPMPINGPAQQASGTLSYGTGPGTATGSASGTIGAGSTRSSIGSAAGSPARPGFVGGPPFQVGSPPGQAGMASMAMDDMSQVTYNTSVWSPDTRMVSSIAPHPIAGTQMQGGQAPQAGIPQLQNATGTMPQNFAQAGPQNPNARFGSAGPGGGGSLGSTGNPLAKSGSSLATDIDGDLDEEFAS